MVTKDEMADYLEDYARHFELPVRKGTRVDCLTRRGESFLVRAGRTEFEAANVIVAMANYQVRRVPPFSRELSPDIRQLHSGEYRNPSQLQDGPVLIVGAGNSGTDIGMEVVQHHQTWMAGDHPGHVPFRIEPLLARLLLIRMVRFVGHRVLNTGTPIGRRARPTMLKSGAPLVRVKPNDLVAAGVTRVSRVTGVERGLPCLEDREVLDVANVIWCTGSRPGFSWIDLPIFQEGEEPDHRRGIVDAEPGRYFVGLNFLYAATSDTVTGVVRDAKYVVRALCSRNS